MTEPSISWKLKFLMGVNCPPGNGWFGCPTLYIGNPKLIGNSTSLRIYPWHNRNWSSQPMSKSRITSMTSQLFNTTMEIRNHIFTASFGGMRWFIRKNKNASQKVYVEVMLQKRKNLKKKSLLPFVWTQDSTNQRSPKSPPWRTSPEAFLRQLWRNQQKRPLTETGITPSFRNDYWVGWMETRSMLQALERLIWL